MIAPNETRIHVFELFKAQFKAQAFPLARLRRIAKIDENMRTMSTEVPLLLAKAAEAFVRELTLRSWDVTKYTRRCTIGVGFTRARPVAAG